MMNHSLIFARAYEKEEGGKIPASARPLFHLTPWVGWMNDPNGFSYYRGQYHLFYQYNPYDTQWDAMHWGHAVSHDLLHWTYLPAALAPDAPYDSFGCFSGSAMELNDGRQLLLYTGVRKEGGDKAKEFQTQCVAVGDGVNYQKYARNPVLDTADLPEGLSPYDFRDPKIWRRPEGGYRCVVGARRMDKRGVLLLFDSDDGFRWRFFSILAENDGRLGLMWECPDFFPLDGKHVLFVSPQDMLPEGFEYHNGNGTVCQIGTFDEETGKFHAEFDQAIDYGIDFYAPQTLLTPDGRRVMIGWMQNWDTCNLHVKSTPWFGQMSLPRELSIKNGRLYQSPLRELEALRGDMVEYKNVEIGNGAITLPGVEGRTVDLEIEIEPAEGELFNRFAVRFAQDETYHTGFSFRPRESVVKVDRKFSGSRRAIIHQRRAKVDHDNGRLTLRLILDRFSVEVFVNDGEKVMSATLYTEAAADGITFFADGRLSFSVSCRALRP